VAKLLNRVKISIFGFRISNASITQGHFHFEDDLVKTSKQKSHRVAPMALINKKSHGPLGSPMAFFPVRGFALWVTYAKVKIKIEKTEDLVHGLSLIGNSIRIQPDLSRAKYEIFGLFQKSLITPIKKRLH